MNAIVTLQSMVYFIAFISSPLSYSRDSSDRVSVSVTEEKKEKKDVIKLANQFHKELIKEIIKL